MLVTAADMDLESTILDMKSHGRLLQELDSVARMANIPKSVILHSMTEHCGPQEVSFVINLNSQASAGIYGLAYVGVEEQADVLDKMMAIAGACIRNYKDARVQSVQDLLDGIKQGTVNSPTVLLIPDFFMGKTTGGMIADWNLPGLFSLLTMRKAQDLQTFVYVSNLVELGTAWGPGFRQHVERNFTIKRA